MASLTLLHWLLIANAAVFMLFVALLLSWRLQQRKEARRLDAAVAVIHKAQAALTNSALGMGKRIKQLDGKVQHVSVAKTSPSEAAFTQAVRLAGLGASVSDLVESCGLPQAEAELMVSMKRQAAMH